MTGASGAGEQAGTLPEDASRDEKQWTPAIPEMNPHPWGVGMPAYLLLHQFGRLIHQAYGEYPDLVGSVLEYKRTPRDVDVRLVLPADHPDLVLFGKPFTRWAVVCTALSLLGKHVTSLPIDFQLQNSAIARTYSDNLRLRLGDPEDAGPRHLKPGVAMVTITSEGGN
jgi:hypothetical protein